VHLKQVQEVLDVISTNFAVVAIDARRQLGEIHCLPVQGAADKIDGN
jgi:hypothetical protein